MSEHKPKEHKEVLHWMKDGQVRIAVGCQPDLTPDEAVALGFALFEHGLYLKGRMK